MRELQRWWRVAWAGLFALAVWATPILVAAQSGTGGRSGGEGGAGSTAGSSGTGAGSTGTGGPAGGDGGGGGLGWIIIVLLIAAAIWFVTRRGRRGAAHR